jgi:hypothetical protein
MAKLTPETLDEITASFHRVGGEAYLDALAMQDPPTFCLLLGKVIQAEIKAEIPKTTNPINLNEAMKTAQVQLNKLDAKE